MQKLQELATYLQLNEIDSLPQLKPIQQKTTLKPSILVILVSALLLIISIFVDLSPLILTVVCVIIPGYMTFQVIGTKVEREYIKYTIYWIAFGLMEVFLQPIVVFIFGTFFLIIIETVIAVALLHPKFNMALILYDRVIRVYVLKQEGISKNKQQPKSKTQQQPKVNVQQQAKVSVQQQPKPKVEQEPKTEQKQQVFIGVSPVKEKSDN